MLELPEVYTLSQQLRDNVVGRTVAETLPPTKAHKFCWFCGDPGAYDGAIKGREIVGAEGFGSYVELVFAGGKRLCVNDGVHMKLMDEANAPKDYQLLIRMADGTAIAFTVGMYGGIMLHDGMLDNEYYVKSRAYTSPFAPEFAGRFAEVLGEGKPTLSAKAVLATEQRFPGVGNGVTQDILFAAGLHPKRKLQTLDEAARGKLLDSVVGVLRDMTDRGGRDSEKDLFDRPGGYVTKMAKGALTTGCPICGGEVVKEAYMGGSVYYCPHCQPLVK